MQKTIFTTNVAGKNMLVEREFEAGLEQVWQAWTDSEILEQWWAPKPFTAVTKSMNFKEGGNWHYYMLGPDGSKFWCMINYLKIVKLKMFTAQDAFCDEEGNKNTELPNMHWENTFTATGAGTKVNVVVTFATTEDLEKIIAMGFKEGFAMAHDNLEELLKSKNNG
ncbi:MAG: SRPBCC domain-containing protein [Bacteroidota bacterium]